MNYTNFIIGIILLSIPLILLILCYRYTVRKYCNDNLNCEKNRFIYNLQKLEEKKEEIENFIGWFNSSSNSTTQQPQLLQPPNSNIGGNTLILNKTGNIENVPNIKHLQTIEHVQNMENKSNDLKLSKQFPPLEGDTNFKDADNKELLNSISPLNKNIVTSPISSISNEPNILFKDTPQTTLPSKQNLDVKSLSTKCNFFNDKCPPNYHPLGNFAINGSSSNMTLTCGNVQNVKPAKAIAKIRNNSVYEIDIIDKGHGYLPDKKVNVTIEGGKGHGASAEVIIDDSGNIAAVNIIKPGYNYTETPDVTIDPPYMNSSCFLCCKNE